MHATIHRSLISGEGVRVLRSGTADFSESAVKALSTVRGRKHCLLEERKSVDHRERETAALST